MSDTVSAPCAAMRHSCPFFASGVLMSLASSSASSAGSIVEVGPVPKGRLPVVLRRTQVTPRRTRLVSTSQTTIDAGTRPVRGGRPLAGPRAEIRTPNSSRDRKRLAEVPAPSRGGNHGALQLPVEIRFIHERHHSELPPHAHNKRDPTGIVGSGTAPSAGARGRFQRRTVAVLSLRQAESPGDSGGSTVIASGGGCASTTLENEAVAMAAFPAHPI